MNEGYEAGQMIQDAYWLSSHGIMPEDGGRNDQSPKFIDACNVIESTQTIAAESLDRVEKKKHDAEVRKLNRRVRRGHR